MVVIRPDAPRVSIGSRPMSVTVAPRTEAVVLAPRVENLSVGNGVGPAGPEGKQGPPGASDVDVAGVEAHLTFASNGDGTYRMVVVM